MCQQEITQAVEDSIAEIRQVFEAEPTRFFTENDLLCHYYSLLRQRLKQINCETCRDRDSALHNLIHCEYPTPFRCSMGGYTFSIRRDDEPAPKRGRYRRGHYDILVLNPDFIRKYAYEEIRAQNYGFYTRQVREHFDAHSPCVLYGLEFMYSRSRLPPGSLGNFGLLVGQDARKLLADQRHCPGFMAKAKILVFVKGAGASRATIEQAVGQSGHGDSILCAVAN